MENPNLSSLMKTVRLMMSTTGKNVADLPQLSVTIFKMNISNSYARLSWLSYGESQYNERETVLLNGLGGLARQLTRS